MKRQSIKTISGVAVVGVLCGLAVLFSSFSLQRNMAGDFLKQLGINKADADIKIGNGMLDGYIDGYGVKNFNNIIRGDRAAVALDLLKYTKQYVTGPSFIKEYNNLREQKKPHMEAIKTPESMQQETVDILKKNIADLETKLKKADAATKPVLEKTLESMRKQQLQAQDPENRTIANYRKGYPAMVKSRDELHAKSMADWEAKYPSDHLHFIKMRLQQFLNETGDIDFDAQLFIKNGKKYFENREYERKSDRWKMAFRAGREVVEPARAFAQEWIKAIQKK
ncbi:hypothetical protein LZZ85_23500 [Terrimonas sp. NA20]|uniref:Uncharacterized protein n=1 Tax=Terrimonas ginsenosidimutans TaxID=2908004 RepID=A0ABS9KYH4_9BACT|nr:hypothetical protein [Terrimonas ginsenosidimutans]MCG2617282.1 hypothetical protein [Terrimonas ginsenosidimutans]